MAKVNYSNYSSGVYEQYDSDDAFTPGDSYSAALKVNAKLVRDGAFVIKNTGSNSITYRILGSLAKDQPTNNTHDSWVTIKSDTALASGSASALESYSAEYAWIWLEIKNTTGGQANTAKVWHRGQN